MTNPVTGRITVFFGHVASNIGDLAINRGTIDLLRRCVPDVRIEFVLMNALRSPHLENSLSSVSGGRDVSLHHLTARPEKLTRYLNDPAMFFSDCGIEPPECVVLASGEHLFDYGDAENHASLFWRILPAYAAHLMGVRHLSLPATYGPFAGNMSQSLIQSLARTSQGLSARDARSVDVLAELGIPVPLSLDPAFHIEVPDALKQRSGKTGVVGIAMRSDGWGIRLSKDERQAMTARFKADGFESSQSYKLSRKVIDHVLDTTDCDIRIYIQTFADRELAEALAMGSRALDRVHLYTPDSVEDYLEELSGLDWVFTSRFHAAILAFLVGTPAFSCYFESHGHKMPGLYDLLGWPEACANGSALDGDAILLQLATALATAPRKLPVIGRRQEELRQRSLSDLKELLIGVADRTKPPISVEYDMRHALDTLGEALVAAQPGPALPRFEANSLAKLAAKAAVVLEFGHQATLALHDKAPDTLFICLESSSDQSTALRRRFATSDKLVTVLDDPLEGKTGVTETDAQELLAQTWFRHPDLVILSAQQGIAWLPALRSALKGPVTICILDYRSSTDNQRAAEHLEFQSLSGRMAIFALK